jgi:uncharacterized membrane protein
MSVLLAFLYPEEKLADGVLEAVEELVREGKMDLEDACAMVKDSNGKVRLHQETNLSLLGAVSGLALGAFLGWFIWLPYLGIPGAILGALAGKISDRGIDDTYMKDLSKEMRSGSSALFLLLRGTTAEAALQKLAPYGGKIFHSSLSKAQELEFEEKLQALRNQKKPEFDRSPEMHD